MSKLQCEKDFQKLERAFTPDVELQKQKLIENYEECLRHYELTLPYRDLSIHEIADGARNGTIPKDLDIHYFNSARATVQHWSSVDLDLKKQLFSLVESSAKVSGRTSLSAWINAFVKFVSRKTTTLEDIDRIFAYMFDKANMNALHWLLVYITPYFATMGEFDSLGRTYFVHFADDVNIEEILKSKSFVGRSDPYTLFSTSTFDVSYSKNKGYVYGYNLGTSSKDKALFLLNTLISGKVLKFDPFSVYNAYSPYAVIAKTSHAVGVYHALDEETQVIVPAACIDRSSISYVHLHEGFPRIDNL